MNDKTGQPSDEQPGTGPTVEQHVGSVLARELPRRHNLLLPMRPDFTPGREELKTPGPFGVATIDDPGTITPIQPARQMGTFQVLSNTTGALPSVYVLSIKRPTLVQVLFWNYGSNTPVGSHRMFYRAATPPVSTSSLPFNVGVGGMAYLHAPGDWYLAFVCDTAGQVFCSTTEIDNQEAQNYFGSSMREQASIHLTQTDVVLGPATNTQVFAHMFGALTAVNIKNIGPNPARVQLGVGGGPGNVGMYLNSGIVAGNYQPGSEYTFQGPTLLSGDIWGFSILSTTLAVNVFYRSD